MLPFHTHSGCDLVYGFWSVPLPFNWTRGTRRAVRVRADATSSLESSPFLALAKTFSAAHSTSGGPDKNSSVADLTQSGQSL